MHGIQTFERGALRGRIRVPGDKSISHRALILGALAPGTTRVESPNRGADVLATRDAVVALGARVDDDLDAFVVGGGSLHDPAATVDARNSGTTARLLMGVCAGHGIDARFDGDASLRRRPMERVAQHLRRLGADVQTTDGRLPVHVRGIDAPSGGTFELDQPSAQVKSAILLANLRARAPVRVVGDRHSRDHTERMLLRFGRDVEFDGREVLLRPGRLSPSMVRVPGDLSAAAFFLVGAAIAPGSDLIVEGVGANPTRTGVLDALAAMGADLTIANRREQDGEPVADIRVRHAPLSAIEIGGELVVRAIDEIPALAVAAAFAEGTTRVRDAADLRAKESDRIGAVAATLRACGVQVTETPDGLDVTGGGARAPTSPLSTFEDHRIAMAAATLAAAAGPVTIEGARCVNVSFPEFASLWNVTQTRHAAR
jgi:3-phosphoshikimate 1-carboxyvinyltransferase